MTNQPGSLLHSLVVVHVLGQTRPELRALVDEDLAPLLPPLIARLLVVKPGAPRTGRRAPGLRRLLGLLQQDVPLALFTAGSAPVAAGFSATAERLLTTVRLPVVPVWLRLSSQPSAAYPWWDVIYTRLRRPASLPGQLLRQRGTTVQVRLGAAVAVPLLQGLPVAARLPYLQERLAALGAEQTGTVTWPVPHPIPWPVAPLEADCALLEADLAALRRGRRLVHCQQWEVYLVRGHEIPHLLPALEQLRNTTLGPAGGNPPLLTPDPADACYRHLFVYDRRARRLVGACQLGQGNRILQQHGRRGFCLHAVFKLKRGLRPLLRQSLEVSQAFIHPEYQGQPLPLGLVWEGLAQYLRARPQYRYLLSSVNLSRHSTLASRAVLVEFLRQHCFAPELAVYVQARKLVRYHAPDYLAPLTSDPAADLDREKVLQDIVAGLEPGGVGVPLRLRPYCRQQARFLGFHLDSAGSNALHGAVVLGTSTLADYFRHPADRGA